MPRFDIESERLTVFRIDDEYLFRQYFDHDDLFAALEDYYDHENYRFAVPIEEFDAVRTILSEYYFEPKIVEDLEPYCVLIDRYEPHADILRQSVANWTRRGQRFFLMQNELAVREAEEFGARRVSETDFAVGL